MKCLSDATVIHDFSLDNVEYTYIHTLMDIFKEIDFISEVYICGGFMRDYFMGKTASKDIDIFINCSKAEMKKFVEFLVQYGKVVYGQYGSPRFFPNDFNELYVDIVPFYNFIVPKEPIKDIVSLLSNFDITANAIGYEIKSKTLFNPVGGIEDIRDRILRAVRLDFPEKPISKGISLSAVSVFWFRLLHYQSKLGFNFSPETEQWIFENKWRFQDLEAFKLNFFEPLISERMIKLLK